jgi:hypothetical protein
MPGLFDVSKEIILVTGASQGLGRQFAFVIPGRALARTRNLAPTISGFWVQPCGLPRNDESRPHLRLDHVGALLADHDGRRVGVAADQGRHN